MSSSVKTADHVREDAESKQGNAWLAVLSLAVGSFAAVTAEFLPVGVLPEVADTFQISAGTAGLMMTLPGLLAAIAAPGVMLLAGRTDRRNILLMLSTVLLVACLLSAWAPSFWVMLVGRSLVGVTLGAFWALGLAVAVQLVSPDKSHKAAAAVFAGVTAAMILGVPLGTLVSEHFSWRGAFVAAAVIAAAALLIQIAFLKSMPGQESMRFRSLIDFVLQGESRRSLLMILLVFAAHFATYTFVAPLLNGAGIQGSTITMVLLGYGVAGFLSNFVASKYVDGHLTASLGLAKLALFVSLILLPVVGFSQFMSIALVMLWGVAWGALPLTLNTFNRSVSGSHAQAGAAMFTFTAQVAIALGSGGGGLVIDHAGLSTTFVAGAAVVLLSMILLFVRRPAVRA